MHDNPFDKFKVYIENIDQQSPEIQQFFSDVQNILEDSVIASKSAQKSFIGQYIDNYDVDAETALNDSLDMTRETIADMLLYMAASCAEEDAPMQRNFADQVRDLVEPFEEDPQQGMSWQVREFNKIPFNAAATKITPGVSYATNAVGALFINDFSRRLDDHAGLNSNLRLVVEG